MARLALKLLVAAIGTVWLTAVFAASPLVFAVHPYLAAGEIEKRFTPLVRYLVGELGRDVVIRVSRDYDEHIGAVGRDEVDVAFLGPASLLAVERRYGAKPLVGRLEVGGKAELFGYVVVRRDSPIRTLGELRGKRIAFGDPNSTMSFLVPKAVLRAAGIGDADFAATGSLGSHENIALAVLAGEFDAGAIKDETFDKYAARGLRSLVELPRVADHAFVASSRLPAEVVGRLRGALIRLRETQDGQAILRSIQPNLTAIVAARSSDYDSLRRALGVAARGSEAARR